MLDPAADPISLLSRFGPDTLDASPPVSEAEALAYVRGLAASHYENFSVLTRLVPERLRDDFAAVYAYCRWSDDLADETGSDDAARQRSLELLNWWRGLVRACFDRSADAPLPRHPVFVALRTTIDRHDGRLAIKPFEDLLDAFVQDQRVTRYQTWDQVVDYCRRSADPVGRIVLALAGYADTPENAERYRLSDRTCTALQLINFWQDVKRDLVERDRVYIPLADAGLTVEQLRDWAARPDDPAARVPFIKMMRPLVDKTDELFSEGGGLPSMLDREIRPVVWLFGAGGRAVLKRVRRIGCATLWHRPKLSKVRALSLVGRAWVMSKTGL